MSRERFFSWLAGLSSCKVNAGISSHQFKRQRKDSRTWLDCFVPPPPGFHLWSGTSTYDAGPFSGHITKQAGSGASPLSREQQRNEAEPENWGKQGAGGKVHTGQRTRMTDPIVVIISKYMHVSPNSSHCVSSTHTTLYFKYISIKLGKNCCWNWPQKFND